MKTSVPATIPKRPHSGLFVTAVLFLLSAAAPEAAFSRDAFPGAEVSRASAWLSQGKLLLKRGDYLQSLEYFLKDLDLNSAPNLRRLDCYMNLWVLYWHLDRYDEAKDAMKRAAELSSVLGRGEERRASEGALETHRLFTEGLAWRDKGNIPQANACFEKAAQSAAAIHSPALELKVLRIWSMNYLGAAKSSVFMDLNKRAFEMARALNDKTEMSRTSMNLGFFYARAGDYSHSLSSYTRAVEYARAIKDERSLANCLSNIAYVYGSLGDYRRAFEYASEALKISRQDDIARRLSVQFNNLGLICLSRSHLAGTSDLYPRALECFELSCQLARQAGLENLVQGALANMGAVYANLGQFEKAVSILLPAREKAGKDGAASLRGNISRTLGSIYLEQKDISKAAPFFKEALDEARKSNDTSLILDAMYGLGRCQEESGAYDLALSSYNETVRMIEGLGSKIINDVNRSEYIYRWRDVNQRLIDLDYGLWTKSGSSVFEHDIYMNIERMKGRSFLEHLERQARLGEGGASDEREAREDRLREERFAYLRQLTQNNLSRAKKEELEREVRLREDMLNTIFLDRYLGRGVQEISVEPVDVGIVQKSVLEPRAALVEYFLGDDRSFLLLITGASFRVFELPSAAQIRDSLIAYLTYLRDPGLAPDVGLAAARRLYRELVSPADGVLPETVDRLIIVPDGILFGLPFETLVRSMDKRGGPDYLVSRYTVTYSPSASALFYLQKKPKKPAYAKDFLAFADPVHQAAVPAAREGWPSPSQILSDLYKRNGFRLGPIPNSKNEARQISRGFDAGKTDVYLGAKATEKALKALALNDYRIVHFACHAFSDETYPLRSALILSADADEEEDGFLQVQEMYEMRLEADLVVLSACQTGEGKTVRNEGILGLPRVFFYMGARSVVSTLWRIDDRATARFMEYFYGSLTRGLGKAEALRRAKEKMMGTRKYAHPFFWSVFILTGES